MKRYEGLFILNSGGKEEALKETIDKISNEISSAGGKVETVQKMDKKAFARVADRKTSAGFYVNYVFESAPEVVAKLRQRFTNNEDIFRVLFTVAPALVEKSSREITGLMANFNKVILAGNLTRDPELRYTPKGTAVAKLGLAINRTWKNEGGETKEEVCFVDVDAFGRQAEVIAQYMRKGRPLLVEGRLKLDSWEDKNTKQKQSKLKVVLESFTFLDSKGAEGGSGGGEAPRRPAPAAAKPAAAEPAEGEPSIEEDDVPF